MSTTRFPTAAQRSQARAFIASLKPGDAVILTVDGSPREVTVQRHRSGDPGGYGHPDSAAVIVGYGPGRWNEAVTAAGLAMNPDMLTRPAAEPEVAPTGSLATERVGILDVKPGDVIVHARHREPREVGGLAIRHGFSGPLSVTVMFASVPGATSEIYSATARVSRVIPSEVTR